MPKAPPTTNQEAQAVNTDIGLWAALPEADRHSLSRHFSRLLLLAVQLANSIPQQEAF